MPLQAVTLEPLVQGERSIATFRLPERSRHAHQRINHILFFRNIGSGDSPVDEHLREIWSSAIQQLYTSIV